MRRLGSVLVVLATGALLVSALAGPAAAQPGSAGPGDDAGTDDGGPGPNVPGFVQDLVPDFLGDLFSNLPVPDFVKNVFGA